MRTDQVVPDTALTQMLNKDKVTITSLSKSFIRSHLETISNLTIIDTKSQTTTVTKHRIPAQNYLPNRLGNFINFVEHTTRPYGQSQFPTKKELIMGIDGVRYTRYKYQWNTWQWCCASRIESNKPCRCAVPKPCG